MIVSDQMDMISSVITIPFAKRPIWPHRCISERSIVGTG
jgi:hypothetical protein